MLHFHIITLFPESIEPYLKSSIIGRSREKNLIKVSFYDPKKFAIGKHKRVDQRPYGGGPGMILEPTAVLRAALKALSKMSEDSPRTAKASKKALKSVANLSEGSPRTKRGSEVLFFSTDGRQFDEVMAKRLSTRKDILLIAGRYEGVDARVQKILKAKKISVGPYVLTGGELPAATVIDAVTRFVPGTLGKSESLEASRVSSPEVYTRPEVLTWKGKKYRVPKVLLSGNHAAINKWKTRLRSAKRTK